MKKPLLMLTCAAAFAFTACNRAEQAETETVAQTDNYGENIDPNAPDTEAMYRDQASQVTKKMASDLKMEEDTETQTKVQEVYYGRAKRSGEVRQRHQADTSGMYAELREINLDTDEEFEKILTPERYKLYKPRSTTYYAEMDRLAASSTTASAAGTSGTPLSPDAEIKTKTEKDGDTKTEIEDGNTEIKIKRDADGETKIKTTTKSK